MKLEAEKPEIEFEEEGDKKYSEGKESIDIRKIKYDKKDKEITVHYTKYCGAKEHKETIYKSREEPQQVWYDNFYRLLEDLFFLLELPEEYAINTEMKGISISEGNGCTITAVKKFPDYDNKAFCINSPHLPMYEDDKGSATLPRSTVNDIEKLLEETKLYINGKRRHNQLELIKS